ncbi:MAG: pyrroloquinoline quinone-dependent dehydrogenase [Balneolaceae bacterium]
MYTIMMIYLRVTLICVLFGMFVTIFSACQIFSEDISIPIDSSKYVEWKVAGGDKANTKYSSVDQINKSNVQTLEVAWEYRTGDNTESSTIQANPIVVNGVMYISSPSLKIIALDAKTGEEKWVFDTEGPEHQNRGVTYWEGENEGRILFTRGSYLYALNAETGKQIGSFGENGRVDLRKDLDREPWEELSVSSTSPGILYEDLLIMGSRVPEGPQQFAPGHIRAYNVVTGDIEWIFHTIPHPGEEGYETWSENAWQISGGANSWGGMSVDDERGIVFVPTGAPSYHFYGGDRLGENRFSTSIIALDALNGELIWDFQTVRHDIWDYDIPTSPNLVTVFHKGDYIDAVAQVTKTGMVYVLNRETGESLFPIEEMTVPQSSLIGEEVWPTQPMPVKPEPFSRQGVTEDNLTDLSPEKNAWAKEEFKKFSSKGLYDPPDTGEGTIFMPGLHGGAWWGGASVDPSNGMLYINANNIPYVISMVETEGLQANMSSYGEYVYTATCAACHGIDRKGVLPAPSLLDIKDRLTEAEVTTIVQEGKGGMPAVSSVVKEDLTALMAYLFEKEREVMESGGEGKLMSPYIHQNYYQFRDDEEYPAIKPPWGTLNAIDLNKGEIVWQVPLGEYKELTERGIPPTGTQNLGGPITTAGGLIFIAATRDRMFRAFDKDTGEILWETELETGAFATPSTYEIEGKQYIALGVGGNCKYCSEGHSGKLSTPTSDLFVVFALPD